MHKYNEILNFQALKDTLIQDLFGAADAHVGTGGVYIGVQGILYVRPLREVLGQMDGKLIQSQLIARRIWNSQ